MLLGTGIDLVDTGRFRHWPENSELCRKYFHEEELYYCLNKAPRPWAALAGGFAAKESFSKALGTGLRNLKMSDIVVIRDTPSGRPLLRLYGRASSELQKKEGICHLSLSYERSFVIAFVLIEKISYQNPNSLNSDSQDFDFIEKKGN